LEAATSQFAACDVPLPELEADEEVVPLEDGHGFAVEGGVCSEDGGVVAPCVIKTGQDFVPVLIILWLMVSALMEWTCGIL